MLAKVQPFLCSLGNPVRCGSLDTFRIRTKTFTLLIDTEWATAMDTGHFVLETSEKHLLGHRLYKCQKSTAGPFFQSSFPIKRLRTRTHTRYQLWRQSSMQVTIQAFSMSKLHSKWVSPSVQLSSMLGHCYTIWVNVVLPTSTIPLTHSHSAVFYRACDTPLPSHTLLRAFLHRLLPY